MSSRDDSPPVTWHDLAPSDSSSAVDKILKKTSGRPANPIQLGLAWAGGVLDSIYLEAMGIVRLVGWSYESLDRYPLPTLWLDDVPLSHLQSYRYARSDVPSTAKSTVLQFGYNIEFGVPEGLTSPSTLTVVLPDARMRRSENRLVFPVGVRFSTPNYAHLFGEPQVLGRQQIYGSGPPNTALHPDVLDLVKSLGGPVLDFGCGRGLLVEQLRVAGVEAFGLEMDSALIRSSVSPANKPFITLYDGTLPTPFPTGYFRSVVCSEVLEHIPDYAGAVREIARLTSDLALFTVPDASAIPLGYAHGLVPWHILEATHINFFTQTSLAALLHPYFPSLEFGRVGLSQFNASPYFVSLAVRCRKELQRK